MSNPLQLTVPEGAQVNIHIGSLAQLAGPGVSAEPHVVPQLAETTKRHRLRLALAALLVFGGGYVTRSVSTPDANAQGPQTASLGLPPSTYPDVLPRPVPGSTAGLPPSIHVNPLPSPLTTLPGQPLPPLPGGVSGPYAGQIPFQRPGMAVRAPFPVVPDAPQATGQAFPPAAGTPTMPRNPFGLE